MIIHLNGWPGAGKATISAVLAERMGARFIHNHMLHEVAIACTGLQAPERWPLYEEVRKAAYATLVARPASEVFVMTNALCNGMPREEEAWRHVVDLAVKRAVPLVPVVLELDPEENCRRILSPERFGRKLTDPALLRGWFGSVTIQKPDVDELLVLDVSALTPEKSADAIRAHVDKIRASLRPASPRHLRMRQGG